MTNDESVINKTISTKRQRVYPERVDLAIKVSRANTAKQIGRSENETMYISELNVKGFRSLKDVSWKPGKLNVLIGPNGGGKTNLLKVLELLSALAQGRLQEYIKTEGGRHSITWDSRDENVEINIQMPDNLDPELPEEVLFNLNFRFAGSTSFFLRNEELTVEPKDKRNSRSKMQLFVQDPSKSEMLDFYHKEMLVKERSLAESLLSVSNLPLAAIESHDVRKHLQSFGIYRYFDTSKGAPCRMSVVASHETKLNPTGENLIEVLHTLYTEQRDFKISIDSALNAAFSDAIEDLVFRPASDQRIQLGIRWKNLSRVRSAADLSDGTLRFLYLMAILANPEPPPLIAIDEPEAGLHPSMLPIIAEYAAAASEKTQIILSTHSVSMLDAFRDVIPTTTVVECHDGATTLRTLDGEELAYWLKEYTLGDLFRSGELENLAHDTEASE